VRIGLLAYGAIGHEHNQAIGATPGLSLTAVCDTNPERIALAQTLAPEAEPFTDATQMIHSGLIDAVIVSTPPDSHYLSAKSALESGLHTVVEKPMALTTQQCDELIDLAAQQDRTLVVYQNRRFDRDFVTVRRLINEGAIGELFAWESFVGGYSRPCDYWHSDAAVSGGAIFDWGSHYIDQILNLFTADVAYVTGINHKRHWFHATNADHAEVTITFVDGTHARFVHSDLAAARKPKFQAWGTGGAIIADWDSSAEPLVADVPALITVHDADMSTRSMALDEVPAYEFHRELADYIQRGVPMQVNAQGSRDVVAIMEAAEQSALDNGRPVTPRLLR
jgi:predicted dehydrogenase